MPFMPNALARRRTSALLWLALLGFGLLSSTVRAQIAYLGEIGNLEIHSPFILPTNAPFDLSDPLYDSSTTHRPWVETSTVYYRIDPTNGAASDPRSLPLSVKLTTDSFVSYAGLNTSNPTLFVVGFRKTLWTLSLGGPSPITLGPSEGVFVPVAEVSSLAAADRTHLTMIGDGSFQSINITTGVLTPIFSLDGGTGPGQFSNEVSAGVGRETRYHTYGPNGLLYVLDYGNGRMQMLDPENDYAFVSEFALNPDVTTDNMQFAISLNGNIYLGDGLGGGTTYDADGNYLGAFALTRRRFRKG